jgi:hypothetical protein
VTEPTDRPGTPSILPVIPVFNEGDAIHAHLRAI